MKKTSKMKSKPKAKAKKETKKKAAPSKKVNFAKALSEVWPMERDFFERPDRYQYVRKIHQPSECVFCIAEKNKLSFDSLVLAKTEHAMVLANKYPYNTGHLLILPRRHIANIWDLNQDEIIEIALWTQTSMKILDDVYKCKGLNMGMNHGAVAGAGIPEHIHWHVIPRWIGDTNFFPLIAQTKALPETLEQSYDRLKESFQMAMKNWGK